MDVLVTELLQILPEGPKLFPEDMITDLPERFLAAEFIREKVFLLTREEIPYATAVVVEEFKEKAEKNLIVIKATIQVERESQKGILIGGKGRMLKEIGRRARKEMEALFGAKNFFGTLGKSGKKLARRSPGPAEARVGMKSRKSFLFFTCGVKSLP